LLSAWVYASSLSLSQTYVVVFYSNTNSRHPLRSMSPRMQFLNTQLLKVTEFRSSCYQQQHRQAMKHVWCSCCYVCTNHGSSVDTVSLLRAVKLVDCKSIPAGTGVFLSPTA